MSSPGARVQRLARDHPASKTLEFELRAWLLQLCSALHLTLEQPKQVGWKKKDGQGNGRRH